MENLFIFANFSFWMYVCGVNYLTGCGAQIVERDSVQVQGSGKLKRVFVLKKKLFE